MTAPAVECELCPHRCVLANYQRGECRVRVNVDGTLYTLVYGKPCATHVDPIEKKPLWHFLPGTAIYSLATAGCNLHCKYCQNWEISQTDPEDARNVVLHEFAHKLDMLDRFADGAPPLSDRKQYRAWARIMTDEYDNLIDDAERGRRTLLDKYGATNPAEFFAVATELFFEKSRQMRKRHPELYSLFVDYYRQDPAGRGVKSSLYG